MTAKRVTVEALIPWPPEMVFDFIADPANDPLWCPTVSDVRPGTPSADGLPRYTFMQHVGPLHHRESNEIIEFVRPERLRWLIQQRIARRELPRQLDALAAALAQNHSARPDPD